jgi:hypothetical protein
MDILSDSLTSRHTSLIDINMYIYFLLQIWIKTQNYPTTQPMDAVDMFVSTGQVVGNDVQMLAEQK